MKQAFSTYAVTDNRISIGTVIDHGGPISFGSVFLDWDDPQVRAMVRAASDTLARIEARESRDQGEVITMPMF